MSDRRTPDDLRAQVQALARSLAVFLSDVSAIEAAVVANAQSYERLVARVDEIERRLREIEREIRS